jgi:hypothetical protein
MVKARRHQPTLGDDTGGRTPREHGKLDNAGFIRHLTHGRDDERGDQLFRLFVIDLVQVHTDRCCRHATPVSGCRFTRHLLVASVLVTRALRVLKVRLDGASGHHHGCQHLRKPRAGGVRRLRWRLTGQHLRGERERGSEGGTVGEPGLSLNNLHLTQPHTLSAPLSRWGEVSRSVGERRTWDLATSTMLSMSRTTSCTERVDCCN